jgi:hypothetical protein
LYKEKNPECHDCSSFKLWSLPAEKERELGHTYSEVEGLKVTDVLKDKAIAEVQFTSWVSFLELFYKLTCTPHCKMDANLDKLTLPDMCYS